MIVHAPAECSADEVNRPPGGKVQLALLIPLLESILVAGKMYLVPCRVVNSTRISGWRLTTSMDVAFARGSTAIRTSISGSPGTHPDSSRLLEMH